MRLLSFDTETFLIAPGRQAPPMVCASFALDAAEPWLRLRDDALDELEAHLRDESVHFVGQNIAFDFGVVAAERPTLLPLIFDAYDADRVHDIRVRDMMLLNARGELQEEAGRLAFTLEGIVQRRFGVDLSADKKGPDAWRLRYSELDDVPLEQWPDEAVRYVLDDARWPLRVYEDQVRERWGGFQNDPLYDEPGQTRAAFALHLIACWGILTDETAVLALETRLLETVGTARELLIKSGILKGKGKKNKDSGVIGVEWAKDTSKIKALIEAALGVATPRTDPSATFPDGQVKMDEETLRATGHPDLLVLADVMGDEKLLTTYVQALKGRIKRGNTKEYDQRGLYLPGEDRRGWLIQSVPNVLVASGRTSWSRPNLQNPPRKGGVRECFVPRPGHWFLSVDYSFIELVTWAQTCIDLLGYSKLADAIKAGLDPHVDMGVEILRAEHPARWLEYTDKAGALHGIESTEVTYAFVNAARKAGATWAKDARQLAKAANFGLPGGLGAATFCAYAKATYGVDISEDESRNLKTIWRNKWAEAQDYFNLVSAMLPFGQDRTAVVLPRTGFVRGGCMYTAACNTYFQGLAARGAKEAMWVLTQECYTGYSSLWTRKEHGEVRAPLYGCRIVVFAHDEFILEVPAHRQQAHTAAARVGIVMEQAMARFVPDVPNRAEPALMACWQKEAEPVWGADGVLELWRPKA